MTDVCIVGILGNMFGASKYRKERNAKRATQEQTQNADQLQETKQTTLNVSLIFTYPMQKWLLD